MSGRGLAHVVSGDPGAAAGRLHPDRTAVETLPDGAGYDLSSHALVWPVTVGTDADCAAVLDAVLRGVAVVVRVEDDLPGSVAARFVDDLHRAAGASEPPAPARRLATDQLRLLEALASGATIAAAARRLGLSARTASRRLADARRVLGVSTTAEALQVLRVPGDP